MFPQFNDHSTVTDYAEYGTFHIGAFFNGMRKSPAHVVVMMLMKEEGIREM